MQKSSDLSRSSSKDDVQVATGEKSAENNSEIVEATMQMEALNVTETLEVETSQVTESELTQVDASQVTESESTQVETSEAAQNPIAQNNVAEVCAFKIEKPRMPKFNGDVREYAIFKSDFKHISDQNTATEMQLPFCVLHLLENHWK